MNDSTPQAQRKQECEQEVACQPVNCTIPLCCPSCTAIMWGMNDRSHCHRTEELAGYMHHPQPIPVQPGTTAHIQGAKKGLFWSWRFSEPTWRRSEL